MRQLAERWQQSWDRFWFAPGSPRNLTFVRTVVALHALWMLCSRDFAAISSLTPFWVTASPLSEWRYLLFPGHGQLEHLVQSTVIIALVCALVGIVPRAACLVAGMLLYHLAPLEAIFWLPTAYDHGLTLTPPLLVILACAPAAGGYQLWPRTDPALRQPSWRYGWPLRLTWLLVAQVFLFAAIAKAQKSGLAWSSPESIKRWLLLFALNPTLRFHRFGLWLAAHPALCLAIGVLTIVLEWSVVLAVFSASARAILLPVLLAFEIGIMFAMSIHVGETWLVLTFLDVERLSRWMGGLRRERAVAQPSTADSIASAALAGEAESRT